jgi:hypothetical protein
VDILYRDRVQVRVSDEQSAIILWAHRLRTVLEKESQEAVEDVDYVARRLLARFGVTAKMSVEELKWKHRLELVVERKIDDEGFSTVIILPRCLMATIRDEFVIWRRRRGMGRPF